MSWDHLSREQHRVLANGGTVSHTWDANGREVLIESRNAAGQGQFTATSTYSPTDNRLTVAELDGTLCTFGYDAASQIISEERSGAYAYNRSYLWDPLGYRLQQWDSGVLTAGTFNGANELLVTSPTGGTPTTYLWDANGNNLGTNTGGIHVTNTWDAENKLQVNVTSAGTETYQYGQDGLRRKKVNTTGTTLFTIDEQNVLLETNASGVITARYTQSPEDYGGLASQNQSGTSSFHGFDSQMSSRILVSVAGSVTDSYSFKSFGEELQGGSGTVNPHRYVGQQGYYRDAANIMQIGQRKLYGAIGRWISPDPIGFNGGDWNLYRYTSNMPTVATDPTGQYIRWHIDPNCVGRDQASPCPKPDPCVEGCKTAYDTPLIKSWLVVDPVGENPDGTLCFNESCCCQCGFPCRDINKGVVCGDPPSLACTQPLASAGLANSRYALGKLIEGTNNMNAYGCPQGTGKHAWLYWEPRDIIGLGSVKYAAGASPLCTLRVVSFCCKCYESAAGPRVTKCFSTGGCHAGQR